MEEAPKENSKGNTKNSKIERNQKGGIKWREKSILTVLYSFQDSKGEDEASAPQHF